MLEASGQIVPLVSPFTDDGASLSEVRLARLVRLLAAKGCQGVVVASDSGEFGALSFSERKSLLEVAIREGQGNLAVLAHVSTLSTSASLDLAQHAARHGARGAVLMPPYYGTFSEAEIESHLRGVAQYANLPVIVLDPAALLSVAARERLSEMPRLTFAEGVEGAPARSDSFRTESLQVSPAHFFREVWPCHGVQTLLREHSWAAVMKTLLQLQGVETGPPRPPVRSLSLDDERRLGEILAEAA
jgi:dihydrodipicolinate synthase/N-acetylneuraminate lyase